MALSVLALPQAFQTFSDIHDYVPACPSFFATIRHSFSGRFPETRALQSYSFHYADANELEIEVNESLLSRIEMMFQVDTLQDLERQVQVFIDVIVEGRKLQCLEERNQIHDIGRCFPAKTETQVPEHWTKVLDPLLLKRSEDETIITFVAQHDTKNWS
jgi:hypothetical protein